MALTHQPFTNFAHPSSSINEDDRHAKQLTQHPTHVSLPQACKFKAHDATDQAHISDSTSGHTLHITTSAASRLKVTTKLESQEQGLRILRLHTPRYLRTLRRHHLVSRLEPQEPRTPEHLLPHLLDRVDITTNEAAKADTSSTDSATYDRLHHDTFRPCGSPCRSGPGIRDHGLRTLLLHLWDSSTGMGQPASYLALVPSTGLTIWMRHDTCGGWRNDQAGALRKDGA